jgi:YD repeat-containing protein
VLRTASTEYNKRGKETAKTDWRGNRYENEYDALGRLIARRDPYTTIEKLEYNKNDSQVKSYGCN